MSAEERIKAEDIPGTFVFNGRRSRDGFPLNSMGAALNDEANQASFAKDPEEFMERFGLSNEQKEAVRARDWLKMVELGGNVYFICKIGVSDGIPVPQVIAEMAGKTPEEFAAMMRNGGRNPNG
ncbi:protocatechuate 3,4-dioxygenase [Arthrobacter sp. CDRTa11]|uniref:hypothetical protein n=1 Tax=Arthrobacter sp. CDRTa11 TaxID=2651199 RepID=UPI002265CDCC|nr:hypothetical protein [Arthrobacter sp. CDRTa11]UZX02869.1 protocatechuate 3,4-dioxygenase [Arthrobacter sp. CDRTa11]